MIIMKLILIIFQNRTFAHVCWNRMGSVVGCVVASSAMDLRIEPRSGHTKDYKIVFCCFSTKHATLRRNRKDWLAWWGDMSFCGHRRSCQSWHGLTTRLFSNFLFTNVFSIKFLYFFIISSLFPYFNLFVSMFIQSYVNIKLHVSTLYKY
jgi:hypothetical protein